MFKSGVQKRWPEVKLEWNKSKIWIISYEKSPMATEKFRRHLSIKGLYHCLPASEAEVTLFYL